MHGVGFAAARVDVVALAPVVEPADAVAVDVDVPFVGAELGRPHLGIQQRLVILLAVRARAAVHALVPA